MKRLVSTLAALVAVGTLSACADYTTTGAPQDDKGQAIAGAPQHLAGTSWQLKSAGGSETAITLYPITLAFDEALLSGQAPVNTYRAEYHAGEDGTLEIGEIATTRMAGSEGAMAAEAAYLKVLSEVDGFKLGSTELSLTTHGTATLTFVPGAAGPPSGSASADPLEEQAAQTQQVADSVVGMTEEEAEATVTDAGLTYRVLSVDGQPNMATTDYRADRVNVEIEDGEVTKATVG